LVNKRYRTTMTLAEVIELQDETIRRLKEQLERSRQDAAVAHRAAEAARNSSSIAWKSLFVGRVPKQRKE
jgi:hypothetical protein